MFAFICLRLQSLHLPLSVNKTTRKDKTLDLILTNYPATVNKVETLPPIADHDIVYIECITILLSD
jgi:hypothetical protein